MRLPSTRRVRLLWGAGLTAVAIAAAAAFLWSRPGRMAQVLGHSRTLSLRLGVARELAGPDRLCAVLGDSRAAALSGALPGCGTLVNLARPGSTSAEWRAELPMLDTGLPDDAVVVVWAGINDLMRSPTATSAHVAEHLATLVHGLRRPSRSLWILPQLSVYGVDGAPLADINRASDHVDRQLREAFADAPNVGLIDLTGVDGDARGSRPARYADGLHLSTAASAEVVRRIARAMQDGAR